MNKLGFLVLLILRRNKATNKLRAMSIRDILETEDYGYKPNTIYKTLKKNEKRGYIACGLKEGHASTFFITDAGCRFLETENE